MQFVDALLATAQQAGNVNLSALRPMLLTDFMQHGSRARLLRIVADAPVFQQAEYNKAFVSLQYFGYLRREADPAGYDFWLGVMNNQQPGNYRGMVCAFLTSTEYQQRFSPNATRSNADCLAP